MGRNLFNTNKLFFAFVFILSSCNFNKKYYYKENSKAEKLIEASSDSAAYLEAFKNFEISKKVFNDIKKSLGSSGLEAPISFELLNEGHENITYKISFANKDSLEKAIVKRINHLPNSFESSVAKAKNGTTSMYDTVGLYLAPIKVLTANFVTKEYSNYKDITLSYKNVSSKKISAIRFKWYGINAFNEPADMGGLIEGWGGGFSDDPLRAGVTDYATWNILSRDGKKILIAYPYEVAYDDGTKWELK
ncbi:MAG: hypothetical protein RIQ33_1238 [Bacteroidota bacterium]|jgi:hypothetical protein